MKKLNKTVSKILFSGILLSLLLLVGSCENWMSSDSFMSDIESEVHDANASLVNVYVRYANSKWGTTEPSGNTVMKIDVASKLSAVTNDEYGFVKWAAFSSKDFPANKQHSNLIFVSESDYDSKIKGKEQPDSVVHFSDPTSPTTNVKILSLQDDIFIVPIVAYRPDYESSVPDNGDRGVVKNTSIKIDFTKPIDESSLEDEDGNVNFSITSKSFMSSDEDEDNDEELTKDITNYFDYKLKRKGKQLYLTLKDDGNNKKILDNNQTIKITLFESLRDIYGFEMNGNKEFKFKTGTKSDTLAPIIQVLLGGNGNVRLGDFLSFHGEDEISGSATDAALNAPKNIESDEYSPTLLSQRVFDKVYLFVKAVDVIGADANVILDDKTLSEENVAYIGISASIYVENTDEEGKFVTKGRNSNTATEIKKPNSMYISGSIDSKADKLGLFSEVFRDIVPLENPDNPNSAYSSGEIFSFDLSSLPDGLIKIDVWAIDSNGYSGNDLNAGGFYYKNHDNGFKSIFVVKDTTPINADVEKNKVKSKSEDAPYYWYNQETVNSMYLFDTSEKKIVDTGHKKLRSLDENLWWTFDVGKGNKSPAADSDRWVKIHNDDGESLPFHLSGAKAPEQDGPVDITLYLKDDLGNVSDPVSLNSIMYDNTQPTVTLKNGAGDFIYADGSLAQHNSKIEKIEQILKVDFEDTNKESNLENVSGIHRMEITVKKDDEEVAVPLNPETFKVLFAPSAIENPTPESEGLIEVPIAKNDNATTNNLIVFDVDDSSKITSGSFFIYGLTLGDTDGPWTISVNLYDSALNPSQDIAWTIINRDTTEPRIENIYVKEATQRKVYGDVQNEKASWWMPYSYFDSDGKLSKVTFDIKIDERGSGLKVIKVADDIKFTDKTQLLVKGQPLTLGSDYEIDVDKNTITILNPYNPIFRNKTDEEKIEFSLNNIEFIQKNNLEGNKVAVYVEDFVENPVTGHLITYKDDSSGNKVYADSEKPVIAELKIEDLEPNKDTNRESKGYNNTYTSLTDNTQKYTDKQIVSILLTLTPESGMFGSGVKTVILSDNAEFTNNTTVFVLGDDGNYTEIKDFRIDTSKSLTFDRVFINDETVKITNVMLLSDAQGEQKIKAELKDFVGLQSAESKESVGIIYDSVSPVISKTDWDAPAGIAKASANSSVVTDQKFKVEFTEETSGTKIIKFDVFYSPDGITEESQSFEEPFKDLDFKLTCDSKTLNDNDYTIDGRYIILNEPLMSDTLTFENLQIREQRAEGNYRILVSLLDAAENIISSENEIIIDTTDPVIEKVRVVDAIKREVYNNTSDTHQWWLPKSNYDENDISKLSKVSLDITINEAGAGIQVIKLSDDADVKFTDNTQLKLKGSNEYLIRDVDYKLEGNTITLADKFYDERLIRNDHENQFILENVELTKINTLEGNTVSVNVRDFVKNKGINENSIIYYGNTSETGSLIYADNTKPEVAELTIEDSSQNKDNNPDRKGYYNKYTDNNHVILTLKLKAESEKDGSGVQKVTLSENAEFTGQTQIFVDNEFLNSSEYEWTNKTVKFKKVFTAANTLTFTNIEISEKPGEQFVKAYLTDFVYLESEIASSDIVIYDNEAPRINSIEWTSTDSTVSLTNSEKELIDNKTLNIDFTEETAGVKVIKFDITHDGNSYATPFNAGDFELLYNSDKLADTKYDVDGQYIILKEPKDYKSGIFSFNNLTLNGDNDEGQYIINVTLLDAAENINEQTDSSIYNCKLSIDTTDPVIERVDVLDAIDRTDYSDYTNTSTWWMPADKFENDGENTELSKVDLKVTINEIGSGIRYIKLSEDAEFTDNTVLTRVDSNVTLNKGTDYKLDDNHTIELLNPNNPKLIGTAAQPIVIKLENVKLNKINAAEGNKVKVEVEDFVYHDNSNAVTGGYKIYYDEKDYSGLVVYADYTKPVITTLNIKDSAHDSNVNPDSEGLDLDHYTNEQNVELILTLGAESTSAGSGVRIIHLENNAKFTTDSEIFVDNVKLASDKYDITESYVDFRNRVFTAANTIRFTNVHMISGDDKHGQTISAKLTDFVGLESNDKVSDPITLDQHAPQINNIKWIIPDNSVAEGSVNKEEVTDQTLSVNFTEKTAGVKVIKLDVTYENDTESYATPFAATEALELYYGDEPLTLGTDYKIEKGRYIVLTQPRTTGVFNIKNIKLKNTALQGDYEIKVTLLDAAENVDIKSGSVTVDTTHPVIEKVLVKEAVAREVYNDASNAQKWWMPQSKFATDGNVDLEITVDEAGSGLKIIQLSQDVELTSTTKLVIPEKTIAEGADKDYVLDTANNTITINNFDAKLLRNNNSTNSHIVFTLTNVKLKVINSVETGAGNKVAVKVVDFVNNDGTNEISGSAGNYKIFYPDDSDGTLIFADLTKPEITNLRMEDSEQNTENNSENKGTDKTKYTDSQNVVVYLTLKAETLSHGSGVKKITLTDNAKFTDETEIYVDNTPLTTGITWATDKKSVEFDKVFIAANVIKFTNVNLISDENKADQTISAKLTDFVENITENAFVSETITLDTHAPVINSIIWHSDDATVSLTNSQSNEIRNKSLKINFTDTNFGSGVKVIRFDIEHNGVSYTAPFGLTDFSLDYDGTVLTKGTDYTIDGRYIILTTSENYKSGVFTFNNLKLNGTPAEGKYVVNVTLLDAAENKNAQTESSVYNKSLSIDTTDPVIASVQVLDSVSRMDYSDSTNGITWWTPSSKFDAEGNLSAVDLKLTINEIGSGIRFIKLSEDVEYTENTVLKLIENDIESTLVEGTDYTLNQQTRTIELLDHDNAKLNGTETAPNIIIKLENVKLNKINSAAGNKIAVEVEDFVYHPTTNKIANTTSDYQISYADGTTGKVVYADYTAPSITDLRIEDSAQNENNNPESIGYNNQYTSENDNTKKYTDSRDVVLLLKLTSEKLTNGSGVKTVKLSANATFTNETHIYVDGTELASTGFTFASDYKSVNFTKVFTQANTLKFTNVHLGSGNNEDQTINADLTDFVGNNTTSSTTSVAITYDSAAPVITNMAWEAESSAIALGHAFNQNVSNQILRVDFTELTAGTKVIKFDIDHEGTGSYATPFALTSFKLMYGDTELTKGTDYTINGRYIILKEPKTSGTFRFSNIQISDTAIPAEGCYNIKVTLLDAAENINPQDSGDVYSWPISVDTTAPAIQKVQVLGAESRIDYSNAAAGVTWWMPASKFDTNGNLSKIALKLVIKEAGSGLRNIKLSQDVQFTSATILKKIVGETESTLTAGEGHDYILHTDTNTIELLNHQNPILKGTETEFVVIKLENVQLNNINASAGNKIAVELEDFVYHKKTNETSANSGNYTITYPDDTTGTLVYADYTAPVISELRIEDSKQEQDVNPDVKGVNQTLYTNDQNVNLVLNLGAESSNYGSGVKIISLTNNATFTTTGTDTEITKIFVDDVELSASDYTLNSTNVNFGNKVFTAANVIKFTNVNILNGDDKTNQTIKAQLTDFVGLSSAVAADAIVFDRTPASITSIEWVAPNGVAKGSANTNEVTDQTLKVDFTEATAGVKVIKFDVTYDGDPENAASYDAPFSMTNFKFYYDDTELTSTDYAIEDGRYIVLTNPRLSGSFSFENLKLRNASAEGEYNIKITLLDAAENKNAQTESSIYNKKIFIDTTVPVVEKVLIEDAQKREVYNDSSNTKLWWMPSSKFDSNGDLTKLSLQITVNEAGSGLKVIKLDENVAFTGDSKLKKGTDELTKDTDYVLDTTENTITLLEYENPKIRGSSTAPSVVFTLENVKLNNINDAAGNKVAVTVEDFVTNPGSNRIGQTENYKIFYPDDSDGTLIFADYQNPAITALSIEDSAHNAATNPDNKAWNKDNYTDSQDVTLILTLAAEDTDAGSGVKVITLTDNAEFTDDTAIYVDGTELTSGFTWATNNKSVEFSKVFIAANEIKFTNVKLPATEGTYSVKANLKDFAGWNATADSTSNPIMLDTSAPAISEVKWMEDDSTVTAGTTNTAVVANQSLNVAFTEAVSGVKVIKLDITSENNNTPPYATPFADDNFILKCGNTELTDYSVDGKYIILNNTEKTNNFNFHGIKIADTADECVYTIKVTLLDAAENNVIDTKTISIDVTNPEIDGNLRIHDLIRSVELTTDSTVTEKYWLPKAYINASVTTGQAPASIPVYLTIKERTSGIKIFEFSNDVVLTDNTKLYKIDSNAADETASDARTLIPADGYDIKDAHTIKINNEVFAKENFAKKNDSNEEEPFIILVDNIGFANADSSSEVSENCITITLSDVAKNVSNTASTSQTNIYSDSIAPVEPQNLILVDRKNTSDEIAASTGYTNESIVDMKFNLLASEQFGSGYHKFVISGATFKSTDDVTYATDATTVTMTVGSGESAQVIQNLSFEISDEGHTLTLKKSGATADAMAVIRKAVNVEIKNIHLDNPDVEDEGASDKHTVTLKAYDLAGWDSSASTANIKLDKSAPELAADSNGKKGPFVANYTKTYYKPSINVYPHVSSGIETVHGVDVDYSGTSYPTFYTATSYAESGVSAEKFQVKLADGVSYGAVLGIRANDNVMLGGYNRSKTFLYYIADSNFSKTKAQILASGTNLAADINNNCAVGTTNDNYKSTALWFGFTSGKYSAVIVDEAGNVSDVFRFAVVTDTAKPVTSSFANRVLLKRPDESSNVYRNDSSAISTTSDFNYKAYDSGSTSSINTIKYVTKQAENKYQIILNLGNELTSSLVSKLDGTTNSTSTSTSYNELSGTDSSSPIEKYAISTWYGAWPTSSISTDSYSPVVPYGTYFPCGTQTLARSSSALNSDYTRDYFGYSSSFTSTWHAGEGNTSWHIFSENTSAVTDSGNSIRSYVKDNNLIIEIPNNKSTAPVSVFLQDGCGNINYVVCGLKKNGSYETAPSFIIDNKLGPYATDGGVAVGPKILQFPYSAVSSTEDMPWDGYNFKLGAQSANSEAPSSQKGTGEQLGFIKDWVKHATYYNPNLSYSDKTRQFKHGFALHFFDNEDDRNVSENWKVEDITFDDDDTIPTKGSKKASSTEISAGKYTCRVLLYCTNSTTVPTYKQIVDTLEAENKKSSSEKTGQVTDWTYIRVKSSVNEAIVLVDYPQPNLKKLGWTTNDSNHEPVPYYMWYIFEDRVGNYDIGKVVNSVVSGDDLREAPSATSSDFDKWLYDGEKPKLTIRGTSIEPNSISATQADVNKLVATNNGYVPYLDDTTIWVSSDYDREGRDSSLLNSNVGWGTTHEVEYNSTIKTNRRYMPFADLVVDEITGIRAFCWTNSATPPSYTYVAYDGNTQGDSSSNKWYAGYNVTSCYKDIGDSWIYGGNSTNAYFKTSSYSGYYSGTKVNTILPPSKMSSSTEKELYLHVMDWTGNIESYRMGSSASGLKFKNDTTGPAWTKDKGEYSEDEHYYGTDKEDTTDKLIIRIAGTEAGSATRHETMKVYMPADYFSDAGSGFAGFVFGNTVKTINDITKDDDGTSYLEIPYSEYSEWPVDGKDPNSTKTPKDDYLVHFYCFDKVGNLYNAAAKTNGQTCCFTGFYDTVAPAYGSVSFVTEKGKSTEFAHTATDEIKDETSTYGKVTDFTPRTATKHTDISHFGENEVQEIWVNQAKTSRFHINLTSDIDDFSDAIINKWNGSAWERVTSWKTRSTSTATTADSWNHGGSTYRPNLYTLLDFASTGTYYQIITKDLAGNNSYQYFKLYLDNEGPSLATRSDAISTTPTIELGKGSINSVGTDANKVYYYTAETGKELKVNFAITDAGIKNSAQTFKYSFVDSDNESDWTTIQGTDGITEITGKVATGDVDKIYLKDTLGNPTTVDVNFAYTYTDAAGESKTETIPKLCFYGDATDGSEAAPAKPTYTVNNNFHNNDTIKTRAYGTNNNFATKEIKRLNSTSDTILINTKDRIDLQISFTKPNNIIGYLVTDENGNVISQTGYESYIDEYDGSTSYRQIKLTDYVNGSASPSDDIGVYSFNSSLKTSFIETLPLILKTGDLNTDRTEVKRNYYAVDVVGNISEPLVITYSYDDPNNAKDITLIESIDDVLQEDVKTAMQTDIDAKKLYFTSYAKKAGTKLSGSSDNKAGKVYFNDGFIVLRCTFPAYADDDYEEKPNKVELYDVWNNGNSYLKRGSSATTSNSNYANLFKVYPSTQKDDNGRYYCYIAFKINGNFDNNTTYGGSLIYAIIYGKGQAQSDFGYLKAQGVTVDNNYGWQMDKEAPFIDSDADFYEISDSVKKLYNFNIKEPSENGLILLDSIPKAKDNNVRTNNNQTNIYKSGSHIYFQIHYRSGYADYIRDTLSGKVYYKFVVTDPETSSNKNYNATVSASSSGWSELKQEGIINQSGVFGLVLPDVTTPNSHIALFFKDSVNNVSEPYYLGDKSDENVQWWILDRDPEEINVTVDGTTQAPKWDKNNSSYDFDVGFGNNGSGVLIKSITAENASIESVTFNDYSSQPTYDKTTGQFSSDYGWVNISGIKVTLKPNARAWTDQPVKLIINGISKDVFTVPANPLSNSNITIKTAEWKKDTFTYTLNVKTKNGATTANIKDIVLDTGSASATVSWSEDTTDNTKATITLSDVEGQSWTSAKNVKLLVKNLYSGDADLSMGNKLTIPQIKDSDINVTAPTWSGTGTKELNFTIDYPKKADAITSVSSTYGELSIVGTATAGTASARGTATLKLKASKDWIAHTPDFTIQGITKSSSLTIPAIGDSDVTVKQVAGSDELTEFNWASGENVNTGDDGKKLFTFKIALPEYAGSIAAVTSSAAGTVKSQTHDSTTNTTTVTVEVTKAWTAQTLTLTIKGAAEGSSTVEKPIFTDENPIPALGLSDVDVKMVVPGESHQTQAVSWDGIGYDSDAKLTRTFTLEFAIKGNVNLTKLKATYGALTWTSGNTATLKIAPDWVTHTVDLILNDNEDMKKENVISVPKIAAENITVTVSEVTWSDEDDSKTIVLELKAPTAIPADSVTTSCGSVTFNSDTQKATLVVSRDWAEKTVDLTINGIKKENVLTVPKIGPKNITISGAEAWGDAGGTKDYSLTITAPSAIPSNGITVSDGNTVTSSYTSENNTNTLTFTLTKGWSEKSVTINVNGITRENIITIPAIAASDIQVKKVGADGTLSDLTWDENGARIQVFNIEIVTPGNAVISNLGVKNATLEWKSGNTAKLTAGPNFDEPVHLVVNADEFGQNGLNLENVLTVPAVNDEDINIVGKAWDEVDRNADGSKNVTFTITVPVSITSLPSIVVLDGDTELTYVKHDATGNIVYKIPQGWAQKNITFKFRKDGEVKLTKENVYEVPAISADDITIKQIVTTGEGESATETQQKPKWDDGKDLDGVYKEFVLKLSAPAVATSVSTNCGTVTFDAETQRATLTVKPGFVKTNVKLTINGVLTDTGIEVDADQNKQFEDGDIEVTPIASSTWSAETESYEVPVILKNGATVANLDGITLTTNVEGINAAFKKSEGETPSIIEPVTIVLSGDALKTQKWTEQEVKVTIGEATVTVLTIPSKTLTTDSYSINITEGGLGGKNNPSEWYVMLKIQDVPNGLTILECTSSEGKITYTKDTQTYKIDSFANPGMTENLYITVKFALEGSDDELGSISKYLFKEGGPAPDPTPTQSNGNNGGVGALNPTSLNVSGARAASTAYSASATETVSEPVKTRRVSLTSWVNDIFNNDSEVVTETVKDEVKATTAKAAKKAKKAEKTVAAKVEKAPVEKPVITETVESVAVTSATTVSEVVEAATETVANAVTVEEVTPEAKVTMPVVDTSITEIVEDNDSQSGVILWLVLAVFCTAVAGVVVLIFKNRDAKK